MKQGSSPLAACWARTAAVRETMVGCDGIQEGCGAAVGC
jgi:hypothetical protein